MFDTYRELLPILRQHFADRFPRDAQTSDAAYRMSIRAKALDTLRGLLPAATTSNVGIYGSGQAYENLLIRMRAHPLLEVRAYADMMLVELRKVIPAFLRRVDLLDRGGAWSSYLDETRRTTSRVAAALLAEEGATPRDEVTLTDFDPDGEVKVVAAALYAVSDVPDDRLLEIAQKMTEGERRAVLEAYVGQRMNRRHRPGRAFERTAYRFDVLGDYGAFRDLQRHRLLTLEWQRLPPQHGSVLPEAIVAARDQARWPRSLHASAALLFVVGYALYVTGQRQRRLLPTALAEIVPRAILAVAIGIPALIVLFSIFRIIPAGQVGVKVLFGEVEPVPLREGLNVVWNPLYDIVIMDTRVQKHTTRYDAASKDLQAAGAHGPPQRGRDPGAAAGHQVRRAGRHHTVAD